LKAVKLSHAVSYVVSLGRTLRGSHSCESLPAEHEDLFPILPQAFRQAKNRSDDATNVLFVKAIVASAPAMLVQFLNLLNVPIGTVIGAYSLWVLFQEAANGYFDR
jgi:hypothetical protein